MKPLLLLMLFFIATATVHAQDQSSTPTIEEIQTHIFQLRLKANDAQYHLNLLKLTKQKRDMGDKLAQLQQDPNADPKIVKKLQDNLANMDAQMDKAKKFHDLTEQLDNARQNNDKAAADDAMFQLRNL